uniref:Uncharacterized protein n=1 Tax=Tanacetum cinerariifolium TaxID=118510 RepID=A0A6L2JHL7_TANCI|nr:hypothetical protein [Tanacetum cinerariifolium]
MLEKEVPVFFSPQIYPNDPARFLYNKDLFYVKNENTEAKNVKESLEKVLKINSEVRYGYTDLPLSEEDKEAMEFFEEEIWNA